MLNIFRQNTAIAALLTIMSAFLLHLPVLLNPIPYEVKEAAPLSIIVFNLLENLPNSLLTKYIIAATLVALQSLLLNYIFIKHDILYKLTFLPGFVYMLLSSIYPEQMQLTPQLLANTFILLLIQRLFYLYESQRPLLLVLDAGIYIGTGFLFHYDILFFVPFVIISVVIFTSFNIRFILITVLGMLLPAYFLSVYYYVTNRFDSGVELVMSSFSSISLTPPVPNLLLLVPVFVIIPAVLGGYLAIQQNYFKNKVKTRRIIQSMILLAGFGAITILTDRHNFIYAAFNINIALALPLSNYFMGTRRFWFKELIVYLLIGFSLYFSLS